MSSHRARARGKRAKAVREAASVPSSVTSRHQGESAREFDDGTDLDVLAAARDGRGCLSFLLNIRMDDLTFGEWCSRIQGGVAHPRVTRAFGLAIEPDGQWLLAGIASSHPFLTTVFAPSSWCGDWSTALLTLPGAYVGSRILFGRQYSSAILIPKALLFETASSALVQS